MDPELRACLSDLAGLLRKLTACLEKPGRADGQTSLADRIDAALKTITRIATAFLAAAAAVVLFVMLFSAVRSHNVVVEAYNVPKTLADRGLTNQVVSETFLDALNHTQAATRLAGGKLRLTEAWNEPLKLEIPKTGMSLGEFRDLLHTVLSNDIHITGELIQAPGNDLVLAVRGDGIPARRFVFQEPDFITTTAKAAEYIYGTAEPVAFATYLLQQFRMKDGLDFLARTYPSAPAKARPQLATLWAKLNAYSGNFERAVELDGLALKLDPFYWPAWEELAQDKRLLDGPESEWATFKEMHKAASRAPLNAQPRLIDFRLEYNLLHDAPDEIKALLLDRSQVLSGTEGTSAWYGLAMAELSRHGYDSARRYTDEADPDDPQLDGHLHDVHSGVQPSTDQAAILQEREAADRSNWANEAYRNMIPDGSCNLAISYAQLGRREQALRMLDRAEKQNPKVGCGGNTGMVLEYLGDHAGADRAFSGAIARMPDLPDPYEQRGEVRFHRNDFAGAAADFAQAHDKSPHWADPLKYWGDALMGEKHPQEAQEKYDAALACAPEWPELRAVLPNPPPSSSARHIGTIYSCAE